jgi:membrane-associated phospholipid phosphatase
VRLTRRTALRAGAATGAAFLAGTRVRHGRADTPTNQIEPAAGSWKTWVLGSGSELRLPPPPDAAATRSEIAQINALAAQRDAAALDQVRYWDASAPGYRWNEIAMSTAVRAFPLGPPLYRMMALLEVAVADATIAAWDAKYTYNRPRPAALDASVKPVIPTPPSPSYPAEHAAVAGAAAAVLAYVMPDFAQFFTDKAQEAAQSRVLAGVHYPSDVSAGLDLGRAVAERVIARARTDGSDAQFTGTFPTGYGIWRPNPGTTGAYPLGGTWATWVLSSGSQLRPDPPAGPDSDQRAEVRDFPRTIPVLPADNFWGNDPAGRPAPDAPMVARDYAIFYWAVLNHITWCAETDQKLSEYRLDQNPPRAARASALVSVAAYDAFVACWDAKYTYLVGRPIHFDPSITTILPTYNHPSYPSAHSTIAGATSTVLSYLFPRHADFFRSRAEELAASRLWAGIHYRSDFEDGLALGRAVGQFVVQRAMSDGAG